ncbi:hypothetical protein BE11_26340 [Sorangium cellulosum]|nr:hypothetical protein BE11_26340 [Sorangium cellulosum]
MDPHLPHQEGGHLIMAIRYTPPADERIEFLRPTLIAIFSRDTPENREALRGSDASKIRVDHAHRIHFMELEDVVLGRPASSTKSALLRYLVYVNERAIADAELFSDPNEVLHFAAVNYGPVAPATVRGIGLLQELARVREGDYELRSLQIPALHFVSLWLHGVADDLFLPIAPTPAHLMSRDRVLTERALMDSLRAEAAELMRRYASAPGDSGG